MSDPTTFRLRYPAFASVPDATITYWLTDATRFVDDSWPIVADRDPAMMAVAAHNMADQGVIANAASDALAAGLNVWRSGTAHLGFSDVAIASAVEGGFQSSRYGQEYLRLLARNKGGPLVTLPGYVDCNAGYNGYAGPLPYWMQ